MMGEMGQDMDNIAVLSIGTGTAIQDLRMGTLKSRGRGWGMLEWILPNQGNIVTTIMDGSSEASQAIAEVFFKVRKGMCTFMAVIRGQVRPQSKSSARWTRVSTALAVKRKRLEGKQGGREWGYTKKQPFLSFKVKHAIAEHAEPEIGPNLCCT